MFLFLYSVEDTVPKYEQPLVGWCDEPDVESTLNFMSLLYSRCSSEVRFSLYMLLSKLKLNRFSLFAYCILTAE